MKDPLSGHCWCWTHYFDFSGRTAAAAATATAATAATPATAATDTKADDDGEKET